MEIIIILFLILLAIGLLVLAVKLLRWVFRDKIRAGVFGALLAVMLVGVGANHFFFKDMHFLQSEVYPDLYLIKYPEENQGLLHHAIREKVEQHFSDGVKAGQKLSYQKENSIFFYQYYKAFILSVFQDEGTAYFLENEEDLGGMVTEELGMYTKYKLAEFNYAPCKDNAALTCGELRYFNEDGLVKTENMVNLKTLNVSK